MSTDVSAIHRARESNGTTTGTYRGITAQGGCATDAKGSVGGGVGTIQGGVFTDALSPRGGDAAQATRTASIGGKAAE